MIELYVVRHGQAQEDAIGGDALRALTAKARKRLHKTARNLADRSGGIDLIFTSPLVRAVQTAEVLAGSCKPDAVEVLAELGPSHSPEAVLAAVVKRAKGAGAIALVGHEPQLSRLVAALVPVAGELEIRAGSVVRIDVDRLPKPRKALARWWLKSGRHKGLPLKEQPKPAAPKKEPKQAAAKKPAAEKKEAAPKKAHAARPAPARKRPPKKRAAPRSPPSEPEPIEPAAIEAATAAEPSELTPS